MKKNTVLFLFVSLTWFTLMNGQIISTVAGNGTCGVTGDGGMATLANIQVPIDVKIDAIGNLFFVQQNAAVRMVNSSGVITTIAGNGTGGFSGDGGPAIAAAFNQPSGVTLDTVGNIYISDFGNNRVRKINTSGVITTVAGNGIASSGGDGGQATSAQINGPWSVAIDAAGNMYITEYTGNCIRKVSATGIISTIAGTGSPGFSGDGGQATLAKMKNPTGITFDQVGNLYFSDFNNCRVRKVDLSGVITTIAGNGTAGFSGDGGPATSAQIRPTCALAFDPSGNLFIADPASGRIRKVNPAGIISTVAGNGSGILSADGGLAISAAIANPKGVCADLAGDLYITDTGQCRIRKVTADNTGIEDLATNNAVVVYPNPAQDLIFVRSETQVEKLTLLNYVGQEISKLMNPSQEQEIDISQLSPGIYFLKAEGKQGKGVVKVVKE